MSSASLKSNFYYIAPYGVVVLAYVVSSVIAPAIEKYQLIFGYSPYLLLGFAALLSFHFNRGRVLLAALVLGVVYWGLQMPSLNLPQTPLYLLLSVLLPLILALIALINERGILSAQIYLIVFVVGALTFAVGWLLAHPEHGVWQHLTAAIVAMKELPNVSLTQSAMGSILLSAVIMAFAWYFKRGTLNNALLVVLFAATLSFNTPNSRTLQILMFGLSALILLVSLLQDSYNMAYKDELTGLMGRRALNEAMQKLGRRYVIAMLDVDKFKKFNDTHGHDVGDQVLKMVAAQLSKATGGARAYRYGGEEFALLFSGKTLKQVKPHLEAVREAIADYAMSIRSQKRAKIEKEGKKQRSRKSKKGEVSVTISIGAAQRGEGLKTPGQVIKAADEALYQAKRKGRNKVICG